MQSTNVGRLGKVKNAGEKNNIKKQRDFEPDIMPDGMSGIRPRSKHSNQQTDYYKKEMERIKKKRRITVIALLLLLLIICGGLTWYFLIGFPDSGPSRTDPVDENRLVMGGDVMDGVYTKGMTAEEIEAAMQAKADKDQFTLQIGSEMVFENSRSTGQIEIVNPKNNVYPLSVVMTLEDGRKIYESGGIKPGQYISEANLLINLPAGEYPVVAKVNIYSPDGKKVEATTMADLNLIIRN